MPIEFVDALPPATHGPGSGAWGEEEAAQLRANPGQWAILATTPEWSASKVRSWSGIIRDGRTGPWRPAKHFQTATRKVDGRTRLYVRYVGEAGESPTIWPTPVDGCKCGHDDKTHTYREGACTRPSCGCLRYRNETGGA